VSLREPGPSGQDLRRAFLGRYVDDAACLRLFDRVMLHEEARPAHAPAFIVEPSVKVHLQEGCVSRNRFCVIVKHPKVALDITADLFAQGLIAPAFKEEVTVFVMRAVLKRGIFAFGMDASAQRIVKVYTEYTVGRDGEPAVGHIDALAIVDDRTIRAKHYRPVAVTPAWWAQAESMTGMELPRSHVASIYGVRDGDRLTEHHVVLSHPWRHRDFEDAVTVLTLKDQEVTWYLRPWRSPVEAVPSSDPGAGLRTDPGLP
jgi:hypothetical protein